MKRKIESEDTYGLQIDPSESCNDSWKSPIIDNDLVSDGVVTSPSDVIFETLKRCRINISPGEIRIRKELEETQYFCDVSIKLWPSYNRLKVEFSKTDERDSNSYFLVEIPKYYSCDAPLITFYSGGPRMSEFDSYILPIHEWNATMGLNDIIKRIETFHANYDTHNSTTGICMVSDDDS